MSYSANHQFPFVPQLLPSNNICLSLPLSQDLPTDFPFLNFGSGCSFACSLCGEFYKHLLVQTFYLDEQWNSVQWAM